MRTLLLLAAAIVLAAVPPAPATATGCPGAPANDCIAGAVEWFSQPLQQSITGATMEVGEPSTCGAASVHSSVWLKLEVLAPGTWDQFKVNLDAPFSSTLGAYTRANDGTLTQVACSASYWDPEEPAVSQPVLYLPCTAGTTYWLQVGGQWPSESGQFTLWESGFWHFNRTMSQPCPYKHTVPSAPTWFRATGGNGEIDLEWTEAWPGGRNVSVTEYRVYGAPSCTGPFSLVGTSPSRWFDHTGLAPSTTRCYRVSAVNHLGEGEPSATSSATSWALPSAPRDLVAAPRGDGELSLRWSEPANLGGGALTGYRVYRLDGGGATELLGTTTPGARAWNDTGLGRGATHAYRVSAVTSVGEGPVAAAAATTWQVPGAPRDLRVENGFPRGSELTWSAPAEPTPFTHYRVYRAASSTGTPMAIAEFPATTTSFTDATLSPFARYYEVRAFNPAGEGGSSGTACHVFPFASPIARC